MVVGAGSIAAAACASIAGLDDPTSLEANEAGAVDTSSATDVATASDGTSDAGAASDAPAGRTCVGTVLKADAFDNRPDAESGWSRDFAGDGGLLEIANDRLHVRVPAVTSGNYRRQLGVTKAGPKRMCVSFNVQVVKPQDTTGYTGGGDTSFGFIHVRSSDGSVSYYQGIGIDPRGLFAYVFRDNATDTRIPLSIPLSTKWNVYMNADFVADQLTIAVNDREATLTMIAPPSTVTPPSATFSIGVRNLGPTPEAEAFYDDVVVVAE